MRARKRDLVGRTIVAVDFQRFRTGVIGLPWSTDPIITLDNGRKIFLVVAETEVGEYGVELHLTDKQRAVK